VNLHPRVVAEDELHLPVSMYPSSRGSTSFQNIRRRALVVAELDIGPRVRAAEHRVVVHGR